MRIEDWGFFAKLCEIVWFRAIFGLKGIEDWKVIWHIWKPLHVHVYYFIVTFMVLNTFCAIVRTLSQGPRWSNPALKQSTNRSNRSNGGWFKDIFTNKHVAIGIQRCYDKRSEALIKNPYPMKFIPSWTIRTSIRTATWMVFPSGIC